jgi:hypothetical protein
MRSPCALLAAFVLASLAGCTTDGPARSTAWYTTLPGFRGPTGPDVVQLQWALIERPIGDRYLNEDLWALANEQVIPLERKDVLENNGLRIAQVGGLLPAEFQELLRSERSNPNPRRRQVRQGKATTLPAGPVRAQCDLRAPVLPGVTLSSNAPGLLDDALLSFAITPTLANDKVFLSFTPQVQHGNAKTIIQPAEDGSGWTANEQVVTQKYGELSWDVTLAPDEYLLVGCWFASQRTYGKECFVRVDEPRPVQRLLVIRASRQVAETLDAEMAEERAPVPTVAAVAQGSLMMRR